MRVCVTMQVNCEITRQSKLTTMSEPMNNYIDLNAELHRCNVQCLVSIIKKNPKTDAYLYIERHINGRYRHRGLQANAYCTPYKAPDNNVKRIE